MKTSIVAIFCFATLLLWASSAHGRTVISATRGEPVIYAGVGIINRNLGTVTDTLGNFSLKIPPELAGDSVRISAVGYASKTFAVSDIALLPDTIELDDDIVILNELVVKPGKIKHLRAGRKGGSGFIYIDVEGYKAAGQGLATPLKVKRRAWLKEIGFTIITDGSPLSHMKFRVNIYRKEGDSYELQKINPVYFDYDKSQLRDGEFSFVFPDEITLGAGDYYVELEFLENFSGEYFTMKTRPLSGKTRYRYASQSNWETLPFGAPIYIDYDSEE